MEYSKIPGLRFGLIFILLFVINHQTPGQEKLNVYAGFGLMDFINAGVRYQARQDTLQLGISLGFGQGLQAFSGDLYYHFAGSSRFSNRRPWYLKSGFNIIHESSEENSDWGLLFNFRMGRDLNLSKKTGINLEAGLGISPFTEIMMEETKLYPSMGIYFYYRIISNKTNKQVVK